MIINGISLAFLKPIKDMLLGKHKAHGVSHGLSEVGYDLRVKQQVRFFPPDPLKMVHMVRNEKMYPRNYYEENLQRAFFGYTEVINDDDSIVRTVGRTALASSVEEFDIPDHVWGELRNKSTHARCFIDATIGTDMEPGWKGFLTIEIIFHRNEPITIPAGSGIAKAVFHELKETASYGGKYQNQEDKPVAPIFVE